MKQIKRFVGCDMNLYILRPMKKLKKNDNPWSPWYDKCFGFVISAQSEKRAREIAQENAGDEERDTFLSQKVSDTTTPWLDPKYSTCEILKPEDQEGVIMMDFASA